jgi:hypothetical protein
MVASRKRRTEEHKLLIASFRKCKDFVRACSKTSPSASKVFWAGGRIVTFPASDRTERSLCKTFQARNRLCFDASNSSSKTIAMASALIFRRSKARTWPICCKSRLRLHWIASGSFVRWSLIWKRRNSWIAIKASGFVAEIRTCAPSPVSSAV